MFESTIKPPAIRDDSSAVPRLAPIASLSDNDSLENHTNLNWKTGKAKGQKSVMREETIRITNQEQKLDAQEFMVSSHYYIDQLKGEFYHQQGGWFNEKPEEEADKQEQQEQTEPAEPAETAEQAGQGKWTNEEHLKFLEALRLYGKDWPRITEHVASRSTKSVISHGQKFLNRLLRFLDGKKKITELSREEAEYYSGILNERKNRCTIERLEREAKTRKLKDQGLLFRVDRVKRKKKQEPEEQKGSEHASSYEKWKQQFMSSDRASFRGSLGHSVKIAPSSVGESKKISFKSKIKIQEEDVSDSDSGRSQGPKHMRKFRIAEHFEALSTKMLKTGLFDKVSKAFFCLPDLKDPDEAVDVHIKVKGHFEGPIIKMQPINTLLIPQRGKIIQTFMQSYPNLYKHLWKRVHERMDNGELSILETPDQPYMKLINSLNGPDCKKIVESLEISFSYKPRERQEKSEPTADMVSLAQSAGLNSWVNFENHSI